MNMWQFLDANWFQTYIFIALLMALIAGSLMAIFKQIYPDVEHELAEQATELYNQIEKIANQIKEAIGQEEKE